MGGEKDGNGEGDDDFAPPHLRMKPHDHLMGTVQLQSVSFMKREEGINRKGARFHYNFQSFLDRMKKGLHIFVYPDDVLIASNGNDAVLGNRRIFFQRNATTSSRPATRASSTAAAEPSNRRSISSYQEAGAKQEATSSSYQEAGAMQEANQSETQ